MRIHSLFICGGSARQHYEVLRVQRILGDERTINPFRIAPDDDGAQLANVAAHSVTARRYDRAWRDDSPRRHGDTAYGRGRGCAGPRKKHAHSPSWRRSSSIADDAIDEPA